MLQVHPSEKVQVSYQNHQMENISNIKYMILDTNGKDLMKYNKKYVLVVDIKPFSLNNYEETLEDLMALNFIMKSENPDFNYSEIMKAQGKIYYNISEETYNKINKLKNIKGIYTYISDEVDTKKAWSVSSFLANILDETQVEGSLQENLQGYLKNNDLPKKNFYLDDKSVYAKETVNISDDNNNLKLTIDKDMEDKIRNILEKEEYKYLKNVGVSIIESDTGKVRALVQKDESEANINLGIQEIGYEPGSIYKIITLASALEMGLVNVNDTFNCNGNICREHHGKLTVKNSLVRSCNDIFAKIGSLVGYDKLMEYSKEQGLYNRVLNLEGENKNETCGIQPKEDAGMNNISIGQCMNVSPVQMLGAINTVVNNGVYVKPYIVESILDKNDNVVKEFKGDEKKIYSEITSRLVKDAMKEVVVRGTGIKAYIADLDIGGKTGSATASDGNTHGWFSGYFKFNNKTYTMVVFIPNIELQNLETNVELGGGDTAAPIFKDIVKTLNNK
ncbi:penicillin-binding protein 2 [Clostridium botulinum]|uniref:penicillin-binding transpeptidase domain-containing protein n=1 Tax=unclassified Clostridium TaxID=2614128 RepID=UPI0013F9F442|nr:MULTISPECIES: penicillin-binding transpeptidase domain-containing protein [unclassified Clostridium]NFN93066.1 penicillin-binding protein 2 [Clostridium botulinum]NFR85850.1 penicillin-binding protein 2 [Clostridium botulinum]NFR89076.1 penicillin-binding protein 2 [Clostridium botulinum]NFS96311.1 penicillin-binding protein 2 [Clostridium botulinum]NFT98031.1 penicillin-binding protein 2 [Clostridium botulinum]